MILLIINDCKGMTHQTRTYIIDSFLHSYSSIFFSQTRVLGLLLLLLSFFNIYAGVYGATSVVLVNLFSHLLQLNRYKIQSGYYGFNALLTGVAIGSIFAFSPFSLFMLFASSMLIVFLSVFIEGVFQKYQLPFVSIPFLIALWCIQLSANCTDNFLGYGITSVQENSILPNCEFFTSLNLALDHLPLLLKTYFYSISGIFFQRNLFFGELVCIGLLHFSRIGFSLSLLNHVIAYYVFQLIDGAMFNTPYELLGFNFIFTSLAVGCYYNVPSKRAIVWSLLLIPLQYLLIFASSRFLDYFYLPTYSLSFCATTLLFLYFIKRQTSQFNPDLATYIETTPEKTKYNTIVNNKRLKHINYMPIGLPFLGIWKVSQGHNGQYTHKSNWKHAWDFIIADKDGLEFSNSGQKLEDYYCYGKPVISPANATVVAIENNIADNTPGADNKVQNWGNYVILRLENNMYIAICHLQQNSICVSINQVIQKGQYIAVCGNSGHSPYPHIHMQVQYTPFIGSSTIEYPVSDILVVDNKTNRFEKCHIPKNDDFVFNATTDKSLFEAFNLTVYKALKVQDGIKDERWDLKIDLYGLNYIDDNQGNYAWFCINNSNFYFYRYEGKKDSNLYLFYLSCYNVALATNTPWLINDSVSLSTAGEGMYMLLQDFLAPIKIFYDISYKAEYTTNEFMGQISISSEVNASVFKKKKNIYTFKTSILENKINSIQILTPRGTLKTIQIKGELYE